jgi:hypothetical protein
MDKSVFKDSTLLDLGQVIFFLVIVIFSILFSYESGCCGASVIPMTRFFLPIFDYNGNKILEFFGAKAEIANDNDIRIFSAKMQTIVPNGEDGMNLLAIVDEADVSIKDEAAVGKGTIVISGEGFSVNGKDWEFVGHNDKRFTITSDVHVFFERQ